MCTPAAAAAGTSGNFGAPDMSVTLDFSIKICAVITER